MKGLDEAAVHVSGAAVSESRSGIINRRFQNGNAFQGLDTIGMMSQARGATHQTIIVLWSRRRREGETARDRERQGERAQLRAKAVEVLGSERHPAGQPLAPVGLQASGFFPGIWEWRYRTRSRHVPASGEGDGGGRERRESNGDGKDGGDHQRRPLHPPGREARPRSPLQRVHPPGHGALAGVRSRTSALRAERTSRAGPKPGGRRTSPEDGHRQLFRVAHEE
ncbi:unnamed protein product [Scytosiphon promiscuus]